MDVAVLVAVSITVPLVCLGLLMTLSWLEDTLDGDVKERELSHPPAPIATMPDRKNASSALDPRRRRTDIAGH